MIDDDEKERCYLTGRRTAYVQILRDCVKELGYAPGGRHDPAIGELIKITEWIIEREEAIAVLRMGCQTHGDNDWPDSLCLADIIDKHLLRHLG